MTTLFPAEFFDANKGTAYHKALAQFEKPLLKEVLIRCHGNQTKAAEILGLTCLEKANRLSSPVAVKSTF